MGWATILWTLVSALAYPPIVASCTSSALATLANKRFLSSCSSSALGLCEKCHQTDRHSSIRMAESQGGLCPPAPPLKPTGSPVSQAALHLLTSFDKKTTLFNSSPLISTTAFTSPLLPLHLKSTGSPVSQACNATVEIKGK